MPTTMAQTNIKKNDIILAPKNGLIYPISLAFEKLTIFMGLLEKATCIKGLFLPNYEAKK